MTPTQGQDSGRIVVILMARHVLSCFLALLLIEIILPDPEGWHGDQQGFRLLFVVVVALFHRLIQSMIATKCDTSIHSVTHLLVSRNQYFICVQEGKADDD